MTDTHASLEGFAPAARAWFAANFAAPTPVQDQSFGRIKAGRHALLIAPTGSGKTLAAFFSCLDALGRRAEAGPPGVRVLYISPLKALVYDIERNLRAPLSGIEREALQRGEAFLAPRVAVRTGDTKAAARRAQTQKPAEILVTTPESLYLILGSKQRETLRSVEIIIVDEIHALAATKRGAHLALTLERVAARCRSDPQRIGLSATARPLHRVARFLGGDRPVEIVDASQQPELELTISVPVPDMTQPDAQPEAGATSEEPTGSLWPAIYPRLIKAIRAHRSVLIFVNSRGLCERLARRLNEEAGEELVLAHHGSVAHERRRHIEEALKAGRLRALVATSSLELGIDMGAVDLVLLVESPGSVTSGLQRVGRAGHQVGVASKAVLFPKHRGDLLEAAVIAEGMREGAVEALRMPHAPLDVLAQQIVALVSMDDIQVPALLTLLRRAANYRNLSRALLDSVLDMLSGRYPSTHFAGLRARIHWDREGDRLEARQGASFLALISGGTIPDRGLYPVHAGEGGPRIGELDEEMVHETRAGEVLTLGASSWRVREITRDRVLVTPAPGEVGRLPFWRGEGVGRPVETGRALGRFLAELAERCDDATDGKDAAHRRAERWLMTHYRLDAYAARNLVAHIQGQQQATGTLPSDRRLTLERFRDELGDWRVCILSPFGARLHAPWALAIEALLSEQTGCETRATWNDDGILFRFSDADALPPAAACFFPNPEEIEERVVAQLERSALFAGLFRENAARALLLPRRRPGLRAPLWVQRLRAQNLLEVARAHPSFPIMLETYRSCLRDVFDIEALETLLRNVRQRAVQIDEVETRAASPFARSLLFAHTAAYLYQGDAPALERRAQALTLDRAMLQELTGRASLRDLLDAEVIAKTEAELQGCEPSARARHADALHDLLRRVGDLSETELAARCFDAPKPWLQKLESKKRAVRVQLQGEARWIAVEDAALLRAVTGVTLPENLPSAFLEAPRDARAQFLLRFARCHGPFTSKALSARYGIPLAQVEAELATLEAQGLIQEGAFHPEGVTREWCEPDVLRRLRRRTLAKLRSQVAPASNAALLRFLPAWQNVGSKRSETALERALEQLEGVPLPFSDLVRAILPARVPGFDLGMLSELGAEGKLVWIGAGALGARDGRIALYRRERVALLAGLPETPAELSELQRALLSDLEAHGASFFAELSARQTSATQQALLDALWTLVWAGLVSNDTVAPLDARLGTATSERQRKRAQVTSSAGRWSLVAPWLDTGVSETERAHARALLLLKRYGVVARECLALEATSIGNWSGLYPVFRALEDAGRVRRGHFVLGYTGAQFALIGAVERLRAGALPVDRASGARLLAATDPAQPFGALLPWPETLAKEARPQRSAGARVVLSDTAPLAWLDRSGRRLFNFFAVPDLEPAEAATRTARALRDGAGDLRRGVLRIEQIDGEAATASAFVEIFLQAGFRRGYRGLELERTRS